MKNSINDKDFNVEIDLRALNIGINSVLKKLRTAELINRTTKCADNVVKDIQNTISELENSIRKLNSKIPLLHSGSLKDYLADVTQNGLRLKSVPVVDSGRCQSSCRLNRHVYAAFLSSEMFSLRVQLSMTC